MSHHPDPAPRPPADDRRPADARRPYTAPRLERVDALQQVVLGSSPGFGDSGAGSGPELPPGAF